MRTKIIIQTLTCALCFTAAAQASEISVVWTGGAGNSDWGDPRNWNPMQSPANGNGATYFVTLPSAGATIDYGLYGSYGLGIYSLNTGQSTLNIRSQSYLGVNVLSGSGTVLALDGANLEIYNTANFTGTIGLASRGQLTSLTLANGAGLAGQISLIAQPTGNSVNVIQGYAGTESVTNAGTISAQNGSIGNLALLTNTGTIGTAAASGRVGSFEVASYRFDNTNGQIYVDPTTQLQIASPHFTNYDGATLTGGTYNLHGELILNGPSLSGIGSGTVLNVYNGGGIMSSSANLLSQVSFNQGALSFHETGTNVDLSSGGLTNAGTLTVDTGAVVSANSIYNTSTGTLTVGANSTMYGTGLFNNGQLMLSGTLDARGGNPNSFLNLDATTETLSGGTYILSSTATLNYDSGTGAHGGDIVNIGQNTTLSLAREGQVQVGLTAYDALAQLTSNAGTLSLTGGNHSFSPTTGTFLNDSGGLFTLTNGASARIYGDLTNLYGVSVAGGSLEANNVTNSVDLTVGAGTGASSSYATFFGNVKNTDEGHIGVGEGSSNPYTDFLSAQSIENDGGINIYAHGEIDAGSFTQYGGTGLSGGTLNAQDIALQLGYTEGFGEIEGNVDNVGAQVDPEGGNLEITGDYTQEANGALLDILGTSSYLTVDGNVDLSGIFEGLSTANTTYYAGESFEILHFGGSLTGDFSSLVLPTLPAGLHFTEEIGAHDIQLEVDAVSASPTPEPSFFWLGGAIVSAVILTRRKKGA